MTWLPTTVHADQLQGPLGRLTSAELTAIAATVIQALDPQGPEPWQLALKPEAPLAAAQHCDAIAAIRSAAGLLPLKAQKIRGAFCAFQGTASSQQPTVANQQPQANSQG